MPLYFLYFRLNFLGRLQLLGLEVDALNGAPCQMKETKGLDIRRNPVRENLIFRSKVTLAIRNYLS